MAPYARAPRRKLNSLGKLVVFTAICVVCGCIASIVNLKHTMESATGTTKCENGVRYTSYNGKWYADTSKVSFGVLQISPCGSNKRQNI